ncbi:hypothetical protein J5751_05775 [bacterium]|nr:hypothetical protein [bacterium]
MIVSNAIINIVSTWIVSFTAIHIPYAHNGKDKSNIIVMITINHKEAGDT